MELYFRELGQGQPLIILHGLFGSCDNWLTVSKPLAEKFNVFLVDQRNHGRSPHHSEHSYKAMSEDLLYFIKSKNIADPVILGHSMGGKTAMTFALKYPDKIKKLIVADIAPKYYPPHHQKVLSAIEAVNLETLKSREEADLVMQKHLDSIGERQFLLKNLYRRDDSSFAWRMNFKDIANQIENIGEKNEGSTFNKPTLFLRGENSNYIQIEDENLIKTLFPNSEIKTIVGAGHWVQVEKPIEFVQEVVSFLLN